MEYDLTSGLITTVPLQEAEQGSAAYDIFIKPVKIIVDPPPRGEVGRLSYKQ